MDENKKVNIIADEELDKVAGGLNIFCADDVDVADSPDADSKFDEKPQVDLGSHTKSRVLF